MWRNSSTLASRNVDVGCYRGGNIKPRRVGEALRLLLWNAGYCGSPTRARTWNTLINSQVLYH